MPVIRTLDPRRTSTEDLVTETLYTQRVIAHTKEAKALVAEADKMYADAQAGLATEQALAVTRIDADVQVSLGNRALDGGVAELRALVNQRTDSNVEDPLYKRFFSRYRPSEVIRMALATELPVVEPWLASLKDDADPAFVELGKKLAGVVAQGRAALLAQGTARQAERDFAAGPRQALFADINTGRGALHAALRKLNDDAAWLESFFRQAPRREKDDPEELSVAQAQARLAEKESELQLARSVLDAAQKREIAAQAAAAARASKEAERDAKRKEFLALQAHLAELEDQLRHG